MRDLLVRYLLGELNSHEREQLEAALRDSPELRREFEHLKECLPGPDECGTENCDADRLADDSFGDDQYDEHFADESWEDGDQDRPRGGSLAERTVNKICGDGPCHERPRTAAEITAAYDAPTGTPSWTLADLTVAAGVFLAISMLFVPAVRQSRDASRRTDCVNNLRQIHTMLVSYSGVHGGFFPVAARHENAGIFAVYLGEDGYGSQEELARLLVCRASPVAEDIAQKRVTVRIPTLCELEAASAKERCFWKRMMSPSYAYRIGFVEDGQYCAVRNTHSPHKALMADNPRQCKRKARADLQSDHHGGQNVLFEDGHVDFLRDCCVSDVDRDLIYLNNADQEAAGLGRHDVVLGRSELVPGAGLKVAP